MAGETAASIASGERTDPTVPVVVTEEAPPQPENADLTASLFGESVTEAELRGEEEAAPTGEEAAAAPKGEEPPATPAPVTEEPRTPPPGFVPLAALHEERGKRQAQSQRLQELEATVEALKSGKPAGEAAPPVAPAPPPVKSEVPEGFKVLSTQEFKALAESDVVEAQIYQHNLHIYEKEQAAVNEQEQRSSEAKQRVSQIIETRYAEMEAAVPGIFDEDSAINKELTAFAASQGLGTEYLEVLAEPGTRIVLPDGRVQILGKGAVQLLTLLHNYYRSSNPDPAKIDALKAEGAAEAIKKIQINSEGFRSIGGTPPGGSTIPLDPTRNLSEAEFAALSEKDQERYLSGA